jgi:hypothetical protein
LQRSQEAVFDALLQGIGVDGLPEVIDVGDVLGFLRGRRESDLCCGREMIGDFSPGGAAAVALVNDDEVEEPGRELPGIISDVPRGQ